DLKHVALVEGDDAGAVGGDAPAGLDGVAGGRGRQGDGGAVVAGDDRVEAGLPAPGRPGGDQVVAGPGVDREQQRGVVGGGRLERVVLIDGDGPGAAQAIGAVDDLGGGVALGQLVDPREHDDLDAGRRDHDLRHHVGA